MKKDLVAIIPARYASVRFPAKLLCNILGKPLILHSFENAKKMSIFDEVIVATDHSLIASTIQNHKGKVIMTSLSCQNGTERVAEAIYRMEGLQKFSYIANLQGDHPLLTEKTILKAKKLLEEDKSAVAATACTFLEKKDLPNPQIAKVVLDQQNNALFFSRSPIPYLKNKVDETLIYRHIGLYIFRIDFLKEYSKLKPTPLQLAEDLEQLKILEHGFRMKVAVDDVLDIGVDNPEDVKKVEEYLCR